MDTINVLRGVRTRKAPVQKKQTRARPTAAAIRFTRTDPYGFFIGKSPEEIAYAIEDVRSLKEYAGHRKLVTILNKVKTTVPMTLLSSFFRIAKNNGYEAAFTAISEMPEVEQMRMLISVRSPMGIDTSIGNEVRYKRGTAEPREPQRKYSQIRILKYTKQLLTSIPLYQLRNIAKKEGISKYKDKTRSVLISDLLKLEQFPEAMRERKFSTEILPRCIRTYRSAEWVKRFIPNNVRGIVLRKDNPYSTTFEVIPGWYRPKASWYDNVCMNGRNYNDYQVGYLIQDGDIPSVLIETPEIYAASIDYDPEKAPAGIGKYNIVVPRRAATAAATAAAASAAGAAVVSTINQQPIVRYTTPIGVIVESSPVELAPGLFNRLRALIAGQEIYCAKCNITMGIPAYRSTHNRQQVLFCSQACFENYQFT